MENEWRVGAIELVTANYLEFSARESDLASSLHLGELQSAHGVNDFVYTTVQWNATDLYRVVKVRNSAYDKVSDANSIGAVEKLLFTCEPVGTIVDGHFMSGIQSFPMVGDTVYGVSNSFLKRIFSGIGDGLVSMGRVSNYTDVAPTLNVGKILTSHIAILGNTGSGKSTTLRVFMDRLHLVESKLKESTKFIVFDVHGDYEQLEFTDQVSVRSMHLPLERLSLDDWEAALLPSEKTQKPLLNRALQIAKTTPENRKLIYAILTRLAIRDITQDSFVMLKRSVEKWYTAVFGNEQHSQAALKSWVQNFSKIEGEPQILSVISSAIPDNGPQTIDEVLQCTDEEYTISLEDIEEGFEIVFGEEEVQGNRRVRANTETMISRFRNLKSRYGDEGGILNAAHGMPLQVTDWTSSNNHSKFVVLNLTEFDDDALRLISNYVVRSAFEMNYTLGQSDRNSMPFFYLYLDEAHRYVKTSTDGSSTIFERISREGRKFNVYLGIISQIPSELSRVVLSQTGAFFIHRIQNSTDLDFILHNVPSATQSLVSRLSSLRAGTALLSGNAVEIPFELTIDAGNYAIASSSISPLNDSSDQLR